MPDTAVMDVAYLDVPHVAHVPRAALRVCLPCWEDSCFACWETGCICACQDSPAPGRTARRCRKCRYYDDTPGHLITCEPAHLGARLQVLADSIGSRR